MKEAAADPGLGKDTREAIAEPTDDEFFLLAVENHPRCTSVLR